MKKFILPILFLTTATQQCTVLRTALGTYIGFMASYVTAYNLIDRLETNMKPIDIDKLENGLESSMKVRVKSLAQFKQKFSSFFSRNSDN